MKILVGILVVLVIGLLWLIHEASNAPDWTDYDDHHEGMLK